ncbi:MAG: MFS transporter [Ilumatobacteraceae bacterium]
MGEAEAKQGESGALRVVISSAFVIAMGAVSANTMGYLVPDLMDDLGISRAAAGLITGMFFGATGAGAFTAGWLVERLGVRRALVIASLTVTVMATSSSVIGDYWILLVYGLLCGFAYSMATIGTNVAVASVVTERRRGVAMTTKTSFAPFFSGSSAILVGLFIDDVGWRNVLYVIAGLSVFVALQTSINIPKRASTQTTRADGRSPSSPAPRVVWVYGVSVFLSSGGGSAFFLWIVPYLKQQLELSSRTTGFVAGGMTMSSALGMITIATFSDRLGVARRFHVIITLTVTCGVAALALAANDLLPTWLLFVFLAAGVLTVATNSGLMHVAIVELAPGSVARATGITLTGYYLGSFVAPYAFGFMADNFGYPAAWLASGLALIVACVMLVWIQTAVVRRQTVS